MDTASIKELHLFDFDDTLFRSPEPPADLDIKDTHKDWWAHPRSLKPPYVPSNANLWIGPSVRDAKLAATKPNVLAALVTGRSQKVPELRKTVTNLLKSAGIEFDAEFFNPNEPTVAWKAKVARQLLKKLPNVEVLQAWDDRDDILAAYADVADTLGIGFEPHHVRAAQHESLGGLVRRLASRVKYAADPLAP